MRRGAPQRPIAPPPSTTTVAGDPILAGYHLLPAVRGDFLQKLGRAGEARSEFTRAAALTKNARERDLLLKRAAAAQCR